MDKGEVQQKIKKFICDELIRRSDYPLEKETALITGGLIDSFSLAQIGVFVEDEFGVYIPDTDLNVKSMDTLKHIVDRILAG